MGIFDNIDTISIQFQMQKLIILLETQFLLILSSTFYKTTSSLMLLIIFEQRLLLDLNMDVFIPSILLASLFLLTAICLSTLRINKDFVAAFVTIPNLLKFLQSSTKILKIKILSSMLTVLPCSIIQILMHITLIMLVMTKWIYLLLLQFLVPTDHQVPWHQQRILQVCCLFSYTSFQQV